MITPSHCPRSGSSNPSRSPPKGDGQALCHPWTAQGARPAAGASQGLLLGRSAVLLGPAQRVLTYLHNPLRELVRRADQLLRHLERRIYNLLARAALRTHIRKNAIDGVKELPHRLKRRVFCGLERFDDAISAIGAYFCAGHEVLLLLSLIHISEPTR